MQTNPDGTFTVAHMVYLARMSLGPRTKRDTPRHILRHMEKQDALFGHVLSDAERKEILCEAELGIARDMLADAKERLRKAELAAELAAGRKERARPALSVVGE